MDFSRTTPFDPMKGADELVRYKFPPTRVILEEFNIIDFQSALFTRAGRKIEEFEEVTQDARGAVHSVHPDLVRCLRHGAHAAGYLFQGRIECARRIYQLFRTADARIYHCRFPDGLLSTGRPG